jgi:hypothetical protein
VFGDVRWILQVKRLGRTNHKHLRIAHTWNSLRRNMPAHTALYPRFSLVRRFSLMETHKTTNPRRVSYETWLATPPWKGASRGCLQERAGTRHDSQLASFSRGSCCSSGIATPCSQCKLGVSSPSNKSASRAVGSSQGSRAELEACEVWSVQGQRGTCVTNCHPPPNLGRNLFPRGVFLPHPSQQVQRHSVRTVTSDGPGLPRMAALRAVVRCSQDPAGPEQVNVLLLLFMACDGSRVLLWKIVDASTPTRAVPIPSSSTSGTFPESSISPHQCSRAQYTFGGQSAQ